MSTADDFETACDALKTAALAASALGSSGDTRGGAATATSGRSHVVATGDNVEQFWREVDAGAPVPVHPFRGLNRDSAADSRVMLLETDAEIVVVGRFAKP